MSTKMIHPWQSVMQLADDHWHGYRPPAIEELRAAAKGCAELQFVIGDGLAALNALLIHFDDDLRASEGMSLARFLACLAELQFTLRLFEADTLSIVEQFAKSPEVTNAQ